MTDPKYTNQTALIGSRLRRLVTTHRQGSDPNFFIFATPRSGSTWLAELLATQGRFKIVNEPLNIRKPVVRENLQISDWKDLFRPECRPQIHSYLRTFVDGTDVDLRYKREWPFSKFWHLRTDRIIFKMLFGGEDDINWYAREFNGHVIHLVRHPIAVAQSRERVPRLESYLTTPYCQHFSGDQIRFARRVVESGDAIQIRVLDWTLQNAVPLQNVSGSPLILTYEQLVLEPEVVVRCLTDRYSLRKPEAMLQHIYRASRSTGKSTANSQLVLRNKDELRKRRDWLIDKWRERASSLDVKRAFQTLAAFGIRVYAEGSALPSAEYMLTEKPQS